MQIQHRQGFWAQDIQQSVIGTGFSIPVTKIMETTTDPRPSEDPQHPLRRSRDVLKVHISLAIAYTIVVIAIWMMIHL